MKLIQTQNHLLLIDEEAEINMQDAVINLHNNELHFALEECFYKDNNCKKVIAYYPLIKEAKELDLSLLPNPFEEISVEELALKAYSIDSMETLDLPPFENVKNCVEGFIEGYKAAQSKQFSLEDMKKALSEAFKAQQEGYNITTDEIIQSLSTQQLPKEFIPDYDIVHTDHAPNGFEKLLKFKTNSEGKEELVGTYKY